MRWPNLTIRRLARALRAFGAEQRELHERLLLLNRPWEEQLLHWSFDGGSWRLHGAVPPPDGARRYSVTSAGWCPGLRD